MKKLLLALGAMFTVQTAYAYPPCSFVGFEGVVGGVAVQSTDSYGENFTSLVIYGISGASETTLRSTDTCSDGYEGILISIGNLKDVKTASMLDSCLQLANLAATNYVVGTAAGVSLDKIARFKITSDDWGVQCKLLYGANAGSPYATSSWNAFTSRVFKKG